MKNDKNPLSAEDIRAWFRADASRWQEFVNFLAKKRNANTESDASSGREGLVLEIPFSAGPEIRENEPWVQTRSDDDFHEHERERLAQEAQEARDQEMRRSIEHAHRLMGDRPKVPDSMAHLQDKARTQFSTAAPLFPSDDMRAKFRVDAARAKELANTPETKVRRRDRDWDLGR